jgi:hypothetical protein
MANMLRLLILAAALLLAGCATRSRTHLVWIDLGGSGSSAPCTVSLDERPFTLPADEAALAAQSARLAARYPGALISGTEGLSLACYRTSMAVIDRAGFRRVGFVSDFQPES